MFRPTGGGSDQHCRDRKTLQENICRSVAMEAKPFSCCLLADSRGRHLDTDIDHELSVLELSNIDRIFYDAETHLRDFKYDMIILLGGVNHLTMLSKNKTVIPIFNDVPNLVENLTDNLTWFKNAISHFGHSLVICQLTGIDLNRYNHTTGQFSAQQNVLNEGVVLVNRVIVNMNEESGLVGPWLQNTIHALHKGRRIHKYLRFRDGLHPDAATMTLWSRLIVKSIITNSRLFSQ